MRYIKVKNQFVGFHKYENAPKEVQFLRSLHRHMFHVTTKISVDHDNRDLEFFLVQQIINDIISEWLQEENEDASCELIAEYILDVLEMEFPLSRIEVEVSEDNENSGMINNYERFND